MDELISGVVPEGEHVMTHAAVLSQQKPVLLPEHHRQPPKKGNEEVIELHMTRTVSQCAVRVHLQFI